MSPWDEDVDDQDDLPEGIRDTKLFKQMTMEGAELMYEVVNAA